MGTDPEFGSVPIYQGKFLALATTPAPISRCATPYSSKRVRNLEEEREPSSRRFFLFGSFSFFVNGCGNVEKFLQAAGPDYEYATPTSSMIARRHSDSAHARSQTHTQMLSVRGLGYKGCAVFLTAARIGIQKGESFRG